MRYIIKRRARYKITQFYQNVIHKYCHTYSVDQMHKNINEAIDSMYLIEHSLLRRKPTLKRWQQEGWHMANAGKWYYAYSVNDGTIIIEDACQAQNMHEDIDQINN